MSSLKKICMQNILDQIFTLPPLMVDEILLETTEAMKKKITSEIETEVKNKFFEKMSNSIYKEVCITTSLVTPLIVSDIVKSSARNISRKNYYEMFPKISIELVKECVFSAEIIARYCILNRAESNEDYFYPSSDDEEGIGEDVNYYYNTSDDEFE